MTPGKDETIFPSTCATSLIVGEAVLGPIYTVRFLSHATSSRQAYDMTYDCRSVLKPVLKCYDIFSDVHNNRKSCCGPVVSRCRMRQKSYRVTRPLRPIYTVRLWVLWAQIFISSPHPLFVAAPPIFVEEFSWYLK